MKILEIWKKVCEISERLNADPYHVMAIVPTESYGDPLADSGYARGLMQLSKIALKDVNNYYGMKFRYGDLYDPEIALEAGIRYLKLLTMRLGGILKRVPTVAELAMAWNWGVGHVKKWLTSAPENSAIDEAVPKETKAHVLDVMWYYARLKRDGEKFLKEVERWKGSFGR